MKSHSLTFNETSLKRLCDELAVKDPELNAIINQYGYPPFWSRSNSFASLIWIILEQQVSLASAKAAFLKLEAYTGGITPAAILQLNDEELRACYFSRQKSMYARALATAIISKSLSLKRLANLPDDAIRAQLTSVKGIGNWTVDVYLLFVLHRTDVFPTGDLAMINALKQVKELSKATTAADLIAIAEAWRPNRSVATMILWHHYLCSRKIKI